MKQDEETRFNLVVFVFQQLEMYFTAYVASVSKWKLRSNIFLKSETRIYRQKMGEKDKPVPLHATEALGGEKV
jgi:hypothetical protein